MNQFQKIIMKHYGNGDFDFIVDEEEMKDVGDNLLSFLITEFSDSEGCEDLETALSRIDTITNDLLIIQNQLESIY